MGWSLSLDLESMHFTAIIYCRPGREYYAANRGDFQQSGHYHYMLQAGKER